VVASRPLGTSFDVRTSIGMYANIPAHKLRRQDQHRHVRQHPCALASEEGIEKSLCGREVTPTAFYTLGIILHTRI
jgi:hypothetical protein